MNFFDAQDSARSATRRLVVVYIVATILIVAAITAVVGFAILGSSMTTAGSVAGNVTPVLVGTALGATALIFGASIVKTASLSGGGSKVAIAMGGTLVDADINDPLRRRLRNVVEEMAIASGVPMPDLFVLEEEPGINAFAAGYTSSDAAIAVTRGTLETLSRDELQGVIAHEFSHILNGDMRLNIRMMGVLYGIMVVGLLGRTLLRSGHYASLSRRRENNLPVVFMIGLGLTLIGWIGVFFSRVIKAGVSRQREYLADASAVQFTRQTEGIANALKKIGGYSASSLIRERDPEEVSHMLFGTGAKFSSLFATHPPLVARIQALDPSFDGSSFPEVTASARPAEDIDVDSAKGFAASATPTANTVSDMVGQVQAENIDIARSLRLGIPHGLYDAAHSTELSYLLCIAMVLEVDNTVGEAEMRLLTDQLGQARADKVRDFALELSNLSPTLKLPILEVAFPSLKRRPAPQLEFLLQLIEKLARTDGKTSLTEFCYYRILQTSLDDAWNPTARRGSRKLSRRHVQEAAVDVLKIVAHVGARDEESAQHAFERGLREFPDWARQFDDSRLPEDTTARLDQALDLLLVLNNEGMEMLIRALTAAVNADGKLLPREEALLRAISGSLRCPLPPGLTDAQAN